MLCSAQGDMQFVFQAGLMTEETLTFKPAWGSVSVQLAVHLNDFLFISPECDLFVPDLKFKPSFYWAPGATLNYKFGDLFFGAGPFRWIEVSGSQDDPIRKWQIKGQAGLMKSSFCISLFAFMNTDSLFKAMMVGFQAGIVI